MSFRRTMESAFLNEVANHPDVRPHLGGTGDLDLSGVVQNPDNICLVTPHGGWVLAKQEIGLYELHTLFLKPGRGATYLEAARAALRYIFAETDARELVTKVPTANAGAALAARRCGFMERFSRPDAWAEPDGSMSSISYQFIDLDRWVAIDDAVVEAGEWFHHQFDSLDLPPHPDDQIHNRYVGAAVLMMRAGQHRKACWFYNRWARFVGYPLINPLSESPLLVDMSSGPLQMIVEIRDAKMEVVLCRSV